MFNIILVSKHLRAPKKINLSNQRTAAVFAASVLFTTLLVLSLGFAANSVVGSVQVSQLQKQVTEQNKRIAELKADNQRDMNAMALRLAELQAQANRLNALGIRLTRDSKLNGGEFDFNRAPGAGGGEQAVSTPVVVGEKLPYVVCKHSVLQVPRRRAVGPVV